MTIREWLRSSPLERADARVLMQFVTGLSRAGLIAHDNRELSDDEKARLEALASQRMKGVPVPYLTGIQEFFSRPFEVNPDVLIPRPDTEVLVEWALANIPDGSLIADLGTGSGCIAATLALENPSYCVKASDISPKALETARKNAKTLRAEVEFRLGSWLEPFKTDNLTAIVSNPPYIESRDEHLKALEFEPLGALTDGATGLTCIEEILREALAMSFPNLRVVAIEHGWNQGEAVRDLFEKYGFSDAKTHKDYGGNDRFTAWKKRTE